MGVAAFLTVWDFSSHKTHSHKTAQVAPYYSVSICLSNCSGVHEAQQGLLNTVPPVREETPVSQAEDVDLPSKSRHADSDRKHRTNAVSELPSVY